MNLERTSIIDIQEGEYNPSKAITVAQDAIASGKDFSVIFVMNEDMAAGIIQMLDSQGVAISIRWYPRTVLCGPSAD